MFASDLDAASRAQLARGARLVEVLKQPQSSPLPVEEQVLAVWAGTTGRLDDVDTTDVGRFEAEFLDAVRHDHPGILDAIRESKKLEDETTNAMEEAMDSFKRSFRPGEGSSLVATDEEDERGATRDDEIEQEHIVRRK